MSKDERPWEWFELGIAEDPGTTYELENAGARQAALIAMYNALYAELRDKDARTKDVVTWGVTGLTGSILLGALSNYKNLTLVGAVLLIVAVIILCSTLCITIHTLAGDRLSIARILNRMHQAMGAFKPGVYFNGSSLLPSTWIGWGHDPSRDEVYWQSRLYIILLVLITITAIAMILGLSGQIPVFPTKAAG